jgi:SAM-dependent methyltransferase
VSLGAPVVFDTISEYPVSVLAFVVAMAALSPRWERPPQHVAVAGLRAVGWLVGLVVLIAGYRSWFARESLHASRTFYGTFRVVDEPANDETPVPVRTMRHGATVHGGQARTPEEQANPTAYYRFGQCIHRATSLVPSPRRFGGVGLGVGAVAAYGRPGDAMTFYEIEPTMEAMAREWFSYMDDSKADSVDVIVGDGRLELLASDAEFDVLLIDAFSGDGVPFHLLTVEALQTYLDRLADDGLLVIHVSNRFFDLRRVLEANTAVLDLPAVYNDRPSEEDVGDPLASRPVCVVLSRERGALQPLASSDGWHDLASLGAGIDAWTDDYLNVFAALK